MKRIDSRTNPLYRAWKSLLSSAGVKKEKAVLISGRKLVPEFLATTDMRLKTLIVSDPKEVELLSFRKTLDVVWLSRDLFDDIDEAGTHFPLLIAEAPPIPTTDLKTSPHGLEVVLAMSNPLNMGAALRSCEAFGVSQVILLKECAHPFLPKVLRASSGSSLRVKLASGPAITELTNAQAEKMCALDTRGESLMTANLKRDLRLFIGEEGRGVPEKLTFGDIVQIPIKHGMDSLNAVAATSIALYAYQQKMLMQSR